MANSFKISGEYKLERIEIGSTDATKFETILESNSESLKSQNSMLVLNAYNDYTNDLSSGLSIQRGTGYDNATLLWEENASNPDDSKWVFSHDMVVNGNFTVQGVITSIEQEDLRVEDRRIVLNSNLIAGEALQEDSGIEIMRGASTPVELKWVEENGEQQWMLAGGKRDKNDYAYHRILTTDDTGSGNELDADTLDGQHGSYYRNAGNLNAGTLPPARFTDTSHGAKKGEDLHALVTTSVHGFMSSADKSKLDNIEPNANEYIHPTFDGDDISLSTGTLSGATILNSLNVELTTNVEGHVELADASYTTREMTFDDVGALGATETAVDSLLLDGQDSLYYLDISNVNAGILSPLYFDESSHGALFGGDLHDVATTSTHGFMSSADKTKLDTISEGADVNQNIIAGTGLTGGGSGDNVTINVVGVDGISVSADDIGLDLTNTRNSDHVGISIIAGNGLVGGGNITASRTLTVGQGVGITVSGSEVSHADTSSQASVDNNNGTVIQDVSVDDFGHVTSLGSVNLDSRFIRNYDSGNTDITEIGRYLDFHTTDSADDYDMRLDCNNANNLTVLGGTLTVPDGMVGNASSASKWQTARTISLSGDVTGSVSVDGTANFNIVTTILDDSHSHDTRYYTKTEMNAFTPDAISSGASKIGVFDEFNESSSTNVQSVLNDLDDAIFGVKNTDITLTMAGDITGSATFTNLGSATLTATVVNDSHTHDGRYFTETELSAVGTSNTTSGGSKIGLFDEFTQSGGTNVQEVIGDLDDKINILNNKDITLTLTGDVSGSATFTNLGSATLTATVEDDSHNHVIANVDGLQATLNGLREDVDDKLGATENAVSASKWATARTITLAGGLQGSVSLDGSGNVTLTSTVVNNSHNHTIGNVTGLQTALDELREDVDGKLGATQNAVSATKLATTRAINGTNFDGTAAITTANWGTARNLTIGATAKSVNGSASVAWSLAEIGAAPSSHTHTIANVTDLQDELDTINASLDGKAPTSHTHTIDNVTDLDTALAGKAPLTGTGTSGTWSISVTGSAGGATNINGLSDRTTAAEHFMLFTVGGTGNQKPYTSSKLKYNPSIGRLTASSYNTSSALKYKDEVSYDIKDALEKVLNIDVISYVAKNDPERKTLLGVTAESVAKQAPEFVAFENGEPDSVNYGQMTALLIKVIQDQEKRRLSYKIKTLFNKIVNFFNK